MLQLQRLPVTIALFAIIGIIASGWLLGKNISATLPHTSENTVVVTLIIIMSLLAFFSLRLRTLVREKHLSTLTEPAMTAFLDSVQDLIQVVDAQGKILYVNNCWLHTLGYSHSEAAHLNIFDIISPDSRPACQARFRELIQGTAKGCFEVTYITRDGEPLALEGNCCYNIHPHDDEVMIRGIFRDVSQRQEQDKQIVQMAYYDMLTQLPNRYLLKDRLTQAISQARRYHQMMAVVYLDLDNLKQINDTHNHATGDILLQKAARRLLSNLRENDTVARIGGDEFLLILTGIKTRDDIPHIIDKVLGAMSAPYIIDKKRIQSSASMGTAIYPLDSMNSDTLLDQADMAMYEAKKQGRNRHCFYSSHIMADAAPPKKIIRLV